MEHRHLNHGDFSAAAIDDVIERGNRSDWAELRDAAAANPAVLRKILRVCEARTAAPGAQRHYLWRYYAARRLA